MVVSAAGSEQHDKSAGGHELIVAADGSIPAADLARLGLQPGQHLRVVVPSAPDDTGVLRGSLAGYPEPTWDDFEHAGSRVRDDFGIS
jgi:hypothetical protein